MWRFDQESTTWRATELYLKSELEVMRKALESPGCDHDRTQFIRGDIARLKKILDLPNEIGGDQ